MKKKSKEERDAERKEYEELDKLFTKKPEAVDEVARFCSTRSSGDQNRPINNVKLLREAECRAAEFYANGRHIG